MKNTLLLLSSLNGNAFNSLMKRLPSMLDNRFLFFCGLEASANAAGCGENLLKLKNQLKFFAIESVELTEYGLDEFLFNHSAKGFEEKPIYLTPVVFSSIITASIEPLYLYDMNPAKEATRMEPFKNAFHCRHNAGDRALDKSSAAYSHVVGSICHFSVDGITYQQVLKGRAAVKDTGIEGYTMICEEAPQYRIKIWDNVTKTKSDLEKVEKMIRLAPSCKDVALPLAFVYNDHDQPIGIVMKDFKGGNQIDLKVWRTLDEPLLYIKQLLEELLRLETNYCLHRDFDHNFLVNQEEKRLCIIDTESIQLGNYRATSFSNLDLNALPKQYEKYSGNAFFNTVEISYSSLTMLLAAYVEVTSLIREWNDAGFVELNNNELNKLK